MSSVLADANRATFGNFKRPPSEADRMVSAALSGALRVLASPAPNPADKARVAACCITALQLHTEAVDRRRRTR